MTKNDKPRKIDFTRGFKYPSGEERGLNNIERFIILFNDMQIPYRYHVEHSYRPECKGPIPGESFIWLILYVRNDLPNSKIIGSELEGKGYETVFIFEMDGTFKEILIWE